MKRFRFFALLSTVLFLMGNLALAQVDPGIVILNQQRQDEANATRANSRRGLEVQIPEVEGPVTEAQCFHINSVEVTGGSVFSQSVYDQIIDVFAPGCLGNESLNNLIVAFNALYSESGYITTRAYFPAQDIASGDIKVEILEGRIEAYIYRVFDENQDIIKAYARKISGAFPDQPGDILNLRRLEHGLEHLNRLSSSQVSVNLSAGQEPGTSQILVTEQRQDTVRGNLTVDNKGSQDTGQTQVVLSFSADDLLHISDKFSLTYSGSENTNAIAYAFSAPYRSWYFTLDGSWSESLSLVSETADLFTQSSSVQFKAEQLISRDEEEKLMWFWGVSNYYNARFINIVPLTPQYRSAVFIGVDQELRKENLLVNWSGKLTFGSRAFNGDWDPEDIDPTAPHAEFMKFNLNGSLQYTFENGGLLVGEISSQFATVPLYANEQFSIGGWGSVRGYAGFGQSGETGVLIKASYYFPAQPLSDNIPELLFGQGGSSIRSSIFMDAGSVHNIATEEDFAMVSIGVNITYAIGQTSLEIGMAIPVQEEELSQERPAQFYLQLTRKLF